MPPDPTTNLGSKRLATLPDYIGHVAPDFRDRKHFNSLVVRPQYRLSLRVGDLEELFPHKPDTPEGRMERMQVLGLFYYPLGHSRAREAFDGMPLQPAVPATATDPALPPLPAVPGLWDHFRTRVMDGASYTQADQEIQRLLKEWIVNGGALPAPAAEGATPTDANFVKFRIPGAYTLMKSWRNSGMNLNDDPAPAYANWTLGKDLYDVETQFRTDNPLLGKIPLVAKVEKFDTASAKWKPAANAQVFFQLADPYDLPAFDSTKPVNAQFNRPPLRDSTLGPPVVAAGTGAAGPGHFASPEEAPTGGRAPNAADPQRGNCPHDRGGE